MRLLSVEHQLKLVQSLREGLDELVELRKVLERLKFFPAAWRDPIRGRIRPLLRRQRRLYASAWSSESISHLPPFIYFVNRGSLPLSNRERLSLFPFISNPFDPSRLALLLRRDLFAGSLRNSLPCLSPFKQTTEDQMIEKTLYPTASAFTAGIFIPSSPALKRSLHEYPARSARLYSLIRIFFRFIRSDVFR